MATIYANMRALQHSNVETIIVFRAVGSTTDLRRGPSLTQHPAPSAPPGCPSPSRVSTVCCAWQCCPLIVCVLDWAFLGRQLPSLRSCFALFVVAAGCAGYVLTDRAFKLNGWAAYTWVTAYFFIISVEMAYGKHIVGPHLSFNSSTSACRSSNTSLP